MGVVIIKEERNLVLGQTQVRGGKKPKKPKEPKDIRAVWNDRDFSVDLRWKGQKDRQYFIYGATEEICVIDEVCFLGKTESNHFIDADIQNGKRRNYQIIAVNKNGVSSEPASFFYDVRFDKPVRYAGMECTTESDWSGIYGQSGYSFRGAQGFEQLPSYISEVRSNGYLKTGYIEEESGPYLPDSNRKHSGYESNTETLSYTIMVRDEKWHQAALYCVNSRKNVLEDRSDRFKIALELKLCNGRTIEPEIFLESAGNVVFLKVRFRLSFILNLKNMQNGEFGEMKCAAIFFD